MTELETIVSEGLMVVSPVQVVRYTHDAAEHVVQDAVASPGDRPRVFVEKEVSEMKIEGDAKRATVYIGSNDTWNGRNLAVAIVERCRELGLAGATVSRGVMGFGKHSVIHKAHFLGLSDDLPERVEIVDRPEEIERLLPILDEMIGGGLIIVEDVHVIRYLHDPKRAK